MKSRSKVLIAPLNWGLGHASRCVPLIKKYISDGWEVVIASDGEALLLLKKEFPNLTFEELPSYNITYPRHKSLIWHLVLMSKNIISNIKVENIFVGELQKKYSFDIIISDNRPGVYHKGVFSIYITHQTNIQAKSVSVIANKVNEHFLKYFNELWIPDFEDEKSLAGILSNYKGQLSHKYIGPLSRFSDVINADKEISDKIIIILSGPEPQRSILEEIILEDIYEIKSPIVLVRGVIEKHITIKKRANITTYNFLTSDKLLEEINSSNLVVSRSGYSSIMDLHALHKRAFFIPTPGQTEQEYLAEYLKLKRIANYTQQNNFKLKKVLELSKGYRGF